MSKTRITVYKELDIVPSEQQILGELSCVFVMTTTSATTREMMMTTIVDVFETPNHITMDIIKTSPLPELKM